MNHPQAAHLLLDSLQLDGLIPDLHFQVTAAGLHPGNSLFKLGKVGAGLKQAPIEKWHQTSKIGQEDAQLKQKFPHRAVRAFLRFFERERG